MIAHISFTLPVKNKEVIRFVSKFNNYIIIKNKLPSTNINSNSLDPVMTPVWLRSKNLVIIKKIMNTSRPSALDEQR